MGRFDLASIFAFTAKKYVKYYDVQLELVDHVACKIEELIVADKSVTFESALQQVYKSYGVYGFTKVAETKFNEFQSMWTRRMWSFLYSYITLPKIFLTILLTYLFYSVFRFIPESSMGAITWQMTSYAVALVMMVIYGASGKFNRSKKVKNLAVTDSYHKYSIGLVSWFYVPIHCLLYVSISPFFCFLVSMLFAFTVILFYGLFFLFPSELESYVDEKYAHLNLEIA